MTSADGQLILAAPRVLLVFCSMCSQAYLTIVAIASLCIGAGCPRSQQATTQPATTPSRSGAEGAGASTESKRPTALSRSSSALLVGVLSRQGQRHCPSARETRWLYKHWEVGFVWLRTDSLRSGGGKLGSLALSSLANRPIIASGARAQRPATPMPAGRDKCPIAQMRSDWVQGMSGMRYRRSGGAGVSAFAATRVQAFEGLELRKKGDRVQVRLTNSLGRDLENIVLRMHYEGCYGKPGHSQRERTIARLAAAKTASVELPQIVGGHRGANRAWSLQISGGSNKVLFDFDLPLIHAKPALAIDCPRRGARRKR